MMINFIDSESRLNQFHWFLNLILDLNPKFSSCILSLALIGLTANLWKKFRDRRNVFDSLISNKFYHNKIKIISVFLIANLIKFSSFSSTNQIKYLWTLASSFNLINLNKTHYLVNNSYQLNYLYNLINMNHLINKSCAVAAASNDGGGNKSNFYYYYQKFISRNLFLVSGLSLIIFSIILSLVIFVFLIRLNHHPFLRLQFVKDYQNLFIRCFSFEKESSPKKPETMKKCKIQKEEEEEEEKGDLKSAEPTNCCGASNVDQAYINSNPLAIASHELRTPLGSVIGYLELLSHTTKLDLQQKIYLNHIQQACGSMQLILENVLDMSKITSQLKDPNHQKNNKNNSEIRPSTVNLRNLIENLASQVSVNSSSYDPLKIDKITRQQQQNLHHLNISNNVHDKFSRTSFSCFSTSVNSSSTCSLESGVDLIVSISELVPESISIDKPYLLRILVNLLSNSFKFTKSGYVMIDLDFKQPSPIQSHSRTVSNDGYQDKQSMRLDTNPGAEDFSGSRSKPDKQLIITVQDTGIGIPEAFKKEMFMPFKQAYSDFSKETKGTGLGLSICKALVEKLEGTIQVDSVEGEGSTFTIKLPIKVQDIISPSTPLSESPISISPRSATFRRDSFEPVKKICVSFSQRETELKVVEILKRFGHQPVGFHTDLNQARDRFENGKFDLVITDQRSLQSSVELQALLEYQPLSHRRLTSYYHNNCQNKLRDLSHPFNPVDLGLKTPFLEHRRSETDETERCKRHYPAYFLTCSNPWLQTEALAFKGAKNVRRIASLGIALHLVLEDFMDQNRNELDELNNQLSLNEEDEFEDENDDSENCSSRISSNTSQISSPITPCSFQFDNYEITSPKILNPTRIRSMDSLSGQGGGRPGYSNHRLNFINLNRGLSAKNLEEEFARKIPSILEYPLITCNNLSPTDREPPMLEYKEEKEGEGKVVEVEVEEMKDEDQVGSVKKDLVIESNRKILVVDDNELNLRLMRFNLKHLGYQKTYFAKDGEEALKMIDQMKFDLILMDCEMPGMSGLEVTDVIRSKINNQNCKIPILAVTANNLKPDELKDLQESSIGKRNLLSNTLKTATTVTNGSTKNNKTRRRTTIKKRGTIKGRMRLSSVGGRSNNDENDDKEDEGDENEDEEEDEEDCQVDRSKADEFNKYKFGKMNEYLVKPVKIKDLEKVLKTYL